MASDKYFGKLVCCLLHTGHAYSSTGLMIETYIFTRSFWLMPARFNWYNMYRPYTLPCFADNVIDMFAPGKVI